MEKIDYKHNFICVKLHIAWMNVLNDTQNVNSGYWGNLSFDYLYFIFWYCLDFLHWIIFFMIRKIQKCHFHLNFFLKFLPYFLLTFFFLCDHEKFTFFKKDFFTHLPYSSIPLATIRLFFVSSGLSLPLKGKKIFVCLKTIQNSGIWSQEGLELIM